jgi:hypothetical protein
MSCTGLKRLLLTLMRRRKPVMSICRSMDWGCNIMRCTQVINNDRFTQYAEILCVCVYSIQFSASRYIFMRGLSLRCYFYIIRLLNNLNMICTHIYVIVTLMNHNIHVFLKTNCSTEWTNKKCTCMLFSYQTKFFVLFNLLIKNSSIKLEIGIQLLIMSV